MFSLFHVFLRLFLQDPFVDVPFFVAKFFIHRELAVLQLEIKNLIYMHPLAVLPLKSFVGAVGNVGVLLFRLVGFRYQVVENDQVPSFD